jgi:hypothetical protein
MMEEPNIQQSLHEIASLLVLVHDFYLKEARGREVSVALLRLIHDVGLQYSVSVLDSERLRRKAMLQSNKDSMGYEEFYDWLRHLSRFVFGTQENPRRALHLMFVQHIIPCTSRFESYHMTDEFSGILQSFIRLTDKAIKVLTEYADFIQHWYFHIVTEVEKPL